MKSRARALAAVALCLCAAPVFADSATPWSDDETLIKQVMQDVQTNGVMAIDRRRSDMEQALAGAKHSTELAAAAGYVLTDGLGDTLTALAAASKAGKTATAVANPYPMIALALGSYYNETVRTDDALRVLEIGIALDPLAETTQALYIERGNALVVVKRFDAALANGDEALKLTSLDPRVKAHVQRERGYALTELGRLDEAVAAYNDSLKDDPGNATAQRELAYIAQLKTGAKPTPSGGLVPLQQPKTQP
jgi:tetratricopeptide (TPR) repeat protein